MQAGGRLDWEVCAADDIVRMRVSKIASVSEAASNDTTCENLLGLQSAFDALFINICNVYSSMSIPHSLRVTRYITANSSAEVIAALSASPLSKAAIKCLDRLKLLALAEPLFNSDEEAGGDHDSEASLPSIAGTPSSLVTAAASPSGIGGFLAASAAVDPVADITPAMIAIGFSNTFENHHRRMHCLACDALDCRITFGPPDGWFHVVGRPGRSTHRGGR
jgi:hypothetical protein